MINFFLFYKKNDLRSTCNRELLLSRITWWYEIQGKVYSWMRAEEGTENSNEKQRGHLSHLQIQCYGWAGSREKSPLRLLQVKADRRYLRRAGYGCHFSTPHLMKKDGSLNGYGMSIYSTEPERYYKSRLFFPEENLPGCRRNYKQRKAKFPLAQKVKGTFTVQVKNIEDFASQWS